MNKNIIILTLAVTLLLFGCNEKVFSNETIKIATFNIQIFGKAKRQKEDVMEVLTKTVRNFDIIAIQEIRDKSETTLPFVVNSWS